MVITDLRHRRSAARGMTPFHAIRAGAKRGRCELDRGQRDATRLRLRKPKRTNNPAGGIAYVIAESSYSHHGDSRPGYGPVDPSGPSSDAHNQAWSAE